MWLKYFLNANIYGFDISDFSHMRNPRFTFFQGDAGSEADLLHLAQAAPSYEVVIDDASHASYHQQLAFKTLFPKISPGGLYVIEDLQWQSPFFENSLPYVPKTAEFFIGFFEHAHYVDNILFPEIVLTRIREQLASFSSFPAFDGSACRTKLIVFRKTP